MVNLGKSGGYLCELTQEVNVSKVSGKTCSTLSLGISKVNSEVNVNLHMKQSALRDLYTSFVGLRPPGPMDKF